MEYVLSTLVGLVIGGAAIYIYFKKIREASSPDEKIRNLEVKLKNAEDKKIELETKGKELYDRYKSVESDHKALGKERDTLNIQVSKYEAEKKQHEERHQEMLNQLNEAKNALEDERKRIRREDEERQQNYSEERDRMWAEHENTVISLLGDLCKKPQLSFSSYDNNNLPEGFHGNLKPDFLIGFLGQYIIFDAKISKASNLQVYITDQVKKTAQKIKGNEKIYPTVFLVVPTVATQELKKISFYEEGFHFFVVSMEALEPILTSLKRIESYEFAEAWDPKERENIIDLIAHFHAHIANRNSFDYLIIEEGLKTLERTKLLDPKVVKEARLKAATIRNPNFGTAEQKKMAADPNLLKEKLSELTAPKPRIEQEELDTLKT